MPPATPTASAYASYRLPAIGQSIQALAEIYRDDVNISVWRRSPSTELARAASSFLDARPQFELTQLVSPDNITSVLEATANNAMPAALLNDIAELVSMFCCLFDQERAGLRLAVLNRAMCPRFHVDRVVCRLISTYHGAATEWLAHETVDRSKLGPRIPAIPDLEAGLFKRGSDIQRLSCGDVALLKGELWPGNDHAGLVHRSPVVSADTPRLLLTLDLCD